MSTVAFVAKAPWVWLTFLALAWAVCTTLLWPAPLGFAFIALGAITFVACVAGRVALAGYMARQRSPVVEKLGEHFEKQARGLMAEEWFERGSRATDYDEEVRCFTEAIRLNPDYAEAYYNRGLARQAKGNLDGALADYTEAIRLKPDYKAYYNRGRTYYNRGLARQAKGDFDGALADYTEAIRLKPDYAEAYYSRGRARHAKDDHDAELHDYTEAIRLKPDYAEAYHNRGQVHVYKGQHAAAVADYQKYLDLGGGIAHGDQAEVEQFIRDLREAAAHGQEEEEEEQQQARRREKQEQEEQQRNQQQRKLKTGED